MRRFGAREIVYKPLRILFAPIILRLLQNRAFTFQGHSLSHFYHRYNMTWASERCVEIPIVEPFLARVPDPSKVLEIGNVLSHYQKVEHLVLDKYEKGPGVINKDILLFRTNRKFDLILSISTFEHIGFDDECFGSSSEKILRAVDAARKLLSREGKLLLTIPIGYNPMLDEMLRDNSMRGIKESYLKRIALSQWEECSKFEALCCLYRSPFPYGNAIAVLEFDCLD